MMASQPLQSAPRQQLHDLVEELADQLCPAVDGKFDFSVKVSAHNETIDKLQMLVNLVLDSASRAVEELRETKDYTENIIRSMRDMLFVVAPDGHIVTANEATCHLLGYGEGELIGQPASMLFREEEDIPQSIRSQDAVHLEPGLSRGRTGEDSGGNAETSLRAKSGQEICVLLSDAMMRDGDGQFRGVVCIAQDITESKRLQAERERFNCVIEKSLNEIYIFDSQTFHFVDVNYGARKNLGYSMAELREMTPGSLKPGFSMESFAELVAPLRARTVEKIQFDTVHRRKDGSQYPVEVHLQLTDGDSPMFVAIILDISERRAAETLLVEAKAAAESSNTAKTEFLANMSHEIRTPMTAILGFAENLREGDLSDSEESYAIETIHKNGEYLLSIINDILDLSKVEAGRMTVEQIRCKTCPIIAEVMSLMRVRADAEALAFHVEYIGAIPDTIQSDPTRLRQILINLIGNAIKFTETGEVRLVTRLVDDRHAPYLQFDVIDTGRGMTQEQVAMLFQPFMQADTSTTRKFGGTGLGLTISKRFAELLGGDITVAATEKGVGTTFRATVRTGPLDGVRMLDDPMSATVVEAAADPVAQATLVDLGGCRILLAEDNPTNQVLIAGILKKSGAAVTTAKDGRLALDAAMAAHDEGKPFDVILMDMQMPVMDGYEATQQLRRNGYSGPIIALTAHAMVSDREKCLKAGCDDYATKPIARKKLIETIQEQLRRAAVPKGAR